MGLRVQGFRLGIYVFKDAEIVDYAAPYGGFTLKDVIQEKFGDGIMSAIDFTMDVQKQADPKGDRVVITMNGKFLPYKKL